MNSGPSPRRLGERRSGVHRAAQMDQRGWKLATVGFVAAAVVLGGCSSQSLDGTHVPTGRSGGMSGGGHPSGGSAAPSGGGGAPSGGGGFGVGGVAGFGPSGGGGFGDGSGGGAIGTGVGGFGTTGSAGGFVTGSGGGGGTSGTGGGGGCEGVSYQVNAVAPDFLIVMSRAMELGSYLDQNCIVPECVKWSILQSAVQTVLAANPTYNYGLMMFGAGGACDIPQFPDVAVSPQNWMTVTGVIGGVTLGGTSPMAETVASAASYLASVPDTSPKYILLVTDGEATCGPGDTSGTMDDSARAEQEISAAYYAGFPTLVLGVAYLNDAQAVANLNTMANAGAYPQVGANTAYYDAGSSAGISALEQAISTMAGPGPDCTFPVPTGGQPGVALEVTIEHGSDRIVVPYDAAGTSGWSYTDSTATAFNLTGAYCSELGVSGQTTVEVMWNCASGGGLPVP